MAIGSMDEFNKKKNDLETQKNEAEAILDGAEVGRLESEIAKLEATKHEYEEVVGKAEVVPENQINQVVTQGGSAEVLAEKTEAVDQEIKQTEQVLNEQSAEVAGAPTEQVESFDVQKMIKEITGGSEKLERFGKGYDNFLNMYTSALENGNTEELKKYQEVFYQVGVLGDLDKINIQKRVLTNSMHSALHKWDDSYDKGAFQEKFKLLKTETDPEIVKLSIGDELFGVHNMNGDQLNKLKEILGGIDNEELFRSLQLAKENKFALYKQQEQEKIKKESDFINERLELTKDSVEQDKLKKRLASNIQNIQDERVQKERSTEADYQKKMQLLSN